MVVAGVDQTTRMSSRSQAFPNPKSPVEVADGVVWPCYRDTNRRRLRPRLSKILDLRLVLEIGTKKVRSLSKEEEEVMENDDDDLGQYTRLLTPDPMDGGRCHGSPREDAWNFPIHGI